MARRRLITDWFKGHGWDFVCFSEHNILMEGEKYRGHQGGRAT